MRIECRLIIIDLEDHDDYNEHDDPDDPDDPEDPDDPDDYNDHDYPDACMVGGVLLISFIGIAVINTVEILKYRNTTEAGFTSQGLHGWRCSADPPLLTGQ